jgi:uncharacterized SAM-binding protein YcdF (DUF218 family)
LILFVFLAAFVLLFAIWRRGRVLVTVAGAALFWLLASGWLTATLLDFAQPPMYRTPYDPAKPLAIAFGPRTAIVVLGGGTHVNDAGVLVPRRDVYARLATAASLYHRCREASAQAAAPAGGICRVIVSGGNPEHHAATEADTYAPYLLRAGVAPADLVLENTSLTTWQNARNVTRLLAAGANSTSGGAGGETSGGGGTGTAADTLLLVTSAYHMPRALLDFQRFGAEPVPVVAGMRRAVTGWLPRLVNLESAQTALHELIGIAQFHVYRMIGWF